MRLVGESRTLLEAFAFMLLENEVLERDDIERLVGAYQGQTQPLEGPPALKSLEPGPAELAAAEAEPPPAPGV
jgi:hypothetical protein